MADRAARKAARAALRKEIEEIEAGGTSSHNDKLDTPAELAPDVPPAPIPEFRSPVSSSDVSSAALAPLLQRVTHLEELLQQEVGRRHAAEARVAELEDLSNSLRERALGASNLVGTLAATIGVTGNNLREINRDDVCAAIARQVAARLSQVGVQHPPAADPRAAMPTPVPKYPGPKSTLQSANYSSHQQGMGAGPPFTGAGSLLPGQQQQQQRPSPPMQGRYM